MPAYNFQSQFVGAILDGSKRQTIRPRRRRATRSGDVLQLYTGMRTKGCRLLRVADCMDVKPIQIVPRALVVLMNGKVIEDAEMVRFAAADGFDDVEDFFVFFRRYSDAVLQNDLEVIYWR